MTFWVRVSVDQRGLTYTSRYIGTHKNLLRLVFAQSIQLSNIVQKNAVRYSSFAIRKPLSLTLLFMPAWAGLGLASSSELVAHSCLSNPMFGAKQLSLTGIRIRLLR